MSATASLLDIRGLTVSYRRGRRRSPLTALDGVSLSVARGETVALVGESGSGKSTLGNVILGLVPAASGVVTFDGEDILHASAHRRRALTKDIQAVFQDPYGSLNPVRSIGQTLAEPLKAHRLASGPAAAEIGAALERVGLTPEAAARYPGQFSGGQRQRIAIARALMTSPRLVICDEPLSSLDLSVQAQILNLLKELQRDRGVSYLLITHDLAVVPHIASRVAVLYRGRVMESGPAAQVCHDPRHPYTQALTAAVPEPDPARQRARRHMHVSAAAGAAPPGPGCVFAPRCPHASDECRRSAPPSFPSGGGSVACWRCAEPGGHTQPGPEPMPTTSATES